MGVKENQVTLLDTYLAKTALTNDAATLQLSYEVAVQNPPHIKVRDWFLNDGKELFGLFTVGDLRADYRRKHQDVPLVEDGRYLVKTWTVAKSGVDGIKLKQKMDDEVKRIYRTYPASGSLVSWESADRLVNGTWIYCTIFTIKVKSYSS